MAAFASTTTSFRLDWGPGSITLRGHQVEKFVYRYEGGTTLVGVRYYVPRDATAAAVITYGIVAGRYDPQAADDIASTFEWQ